ncbi:MmcQ/YjbR family DNA-binding protein [Nocardioides sp. LMS-CY]|uniref:Putative DNA-binding protein (MmcQ/YjbR family) n=1 Tax=Nocardioides soli TaxID=1036020 RepID=A0A7W4Z2S8_9ACTN|nr:MmcQ/YjbR family DNA-binding protein [Nocardioides sp. LMS-CY]MBB3044794.1 putative DNA-binding protein (MmcQ/YjbR family) [Nocardioides soli]QWF19956.1 MmcQ/YjbR family DNA-binding protein [Nocardioides sp. LMS-CY]
MAHPLMFDDDDPVLGRLRAITLALPDAAEKVSHGTPAFYTTKVFAYYGGSEKIGDGHERHGASVLVLADPVERPALLDDPRCFHPMYLGVSGWVGLDLDDRTDWREVAELVETSYRRTAGVRRVRLLDQAR